MNILGRGLESLIPKKDSAPEETPTLDVLEHQAGMREPVHRFYDDPLASGTPVAAVATQVRPAPLPQAPEPRRGESVFWIETAKIEPNPHQPREAFDVAELTSLAESVREHGVLSPLLVTKRDVEIPGGLDVRYQLISGERRLRAAKLAGLREVPVIIRTAETPERVKLELALIENIQREDLNPLERARAFAELADGFGLAHKEIAERVGKSREVISNSLRLLRLPEKMQAAIAANAITEGHARALLMLDSNPEEQKKLFAQIQTAGFTVRDTELAARVAGAPAGQTRRRGRASSLDPDDRELLKRLEEAFGTRVKLLKRGEQGKIIVEFYSDEELRGILERIAKREEGYI